MAYLVAGQVLPSMLHSTAEVSEAARTLAPLIDLKIPPIMGVMTALAVAFIFGLGITATNSEHLRKLSDEGRDIIELFLAIVVNLIATGLKLGDRSQIGAVLLSTSLVADLQLIAAAIVWTIVVHVTGTGLVPSAMASIVSLSGGALVANLVSVTVLVADTLMLRR